MTVSTEKRSELLPFRLKACDYLAIEVNWRITVCINEVGEFIAGPAPVEMLIRNVIMKLPKSSLGKVQPQTVAAMLLLYKFQCPAPILAMHC